MYITAYLLLLNRCFYLVQCFEFTIFMAIISSLKPMCAFIHYYLFSAYVRMLITIGAIEILLHTAVTVTVDSRDLCIFFSVCNILNYFKMLLL